MENWCYSNMKKIERILSILLIPVSISIVLFVIMLMYARQIMQYYGMAILPIILLAGFVGIIISIPILLFYEKINKYCKIMIWLFVTFALSTLLHNFVGYYIEFLGAIFFIISMLSVLFFFGILILIICKGIKNLIRK